MGKLARLFLFAISLSIPAIAVAGPITGSVVDSTGAVLPRALVRIVNPSGKEVASTLTNAEGRFTAAECGGCTIEVSLAGFKSASVKAGFTCHVRRVVNVGRAGSVRSTITSLRGRGWSFWIHTSQSTSGSRNA